MSLAACDVHRRVAIGIEQRVGAMAPCDAPPPLGTLQADPCTCAHIGTTGSHLIGHLLLAKLLHAKLTSHGGPLPGAGSITRQQWTIALASLVLETRVPGDFVETGVYLGGTSIAMMSALAHYNATRLHWACDSFQGLPSPRSQDRTMSTTECRRVRGDDVKACSVGRKGLFKTNSSTFLTNVASYGLPTGRQRLRVVKGWFKDTLPARGMGQIAMLRLDGDVYSSTIDVLRRLYPRLSPGGVLLIDDAGSFAGAAAAVEEYRREKNITATVYKQHEAGIGGKQWPFRRYEAVWWRKPLEAAPRDA